MSKEYWVEAVEIALNEMGVTLSREQIEEIAGSVEGAHENHGMAHGYDVISRGPDPYALESENKRLKSEIADLERQVLVYRKSVATRRGVDVSDVYIENGSVYYGR